MGYRGFRSEIGSPRLRGLWLHNVLKKRVVYMYEVRVHAHDFVLYGCQSCHGVQGRTVVTVLFMQ